MNAVDVAPVLHRLAGYGAYFTVAVGERPAGGGWRPVRDLYAGGALDALIATAARRLGTDDTRVAGSILHQGYAARLWSVVAGAAVAGGVVPSLPDDALYWRSTEHSLVELRTADTSGVPASGDLASRVADVVLDGHLTPFADAVRSTTGVSRQVLAGNTASALVGALRVLAGTDLDVPARRLGAGLFTLPALRHTGRAYLDTSPAYFERDSCCLFYRVHPTALCGDCVLARRPG